MISYEQFLNEVKGFAEENYQAFQQKLIKDPSVNILGVRIPTLRTLAKKYKGEAECLFTFPDDYYEVTFIKLTVVSLLPWEQFIGYIDDCIPLINNWATCDCFKAKCIKTHREQFVPYLQKYMASCQPYFQRYVLTTLLSFYIQEPFYPLITECLKQSLTEHYYVHMAAAWLVAEILIKDYNYGLTLLNCGILDKKTHNKAILKATESYRLSGETKNYLKSLKVE